MAGPEGSLTSYLEGSGWKGIHQESIPHRLGFPPQVVSDAAGALLEDGKALRVEEHLYALSPLREGEALVQSTLSRFHAENPLQSGMALQEIRQAFPRAAGPGIVDSVITGMVNDGRVFLEKALLHLSGFSPTLTAKQEKTRKSLEAALLEAGLSPPALEELAGTVGGEPREIQGLLRLMEREGEVIGLEGGLFFNSSVVERAGADIVEQLGGKSGLGPADFREVLSVTRKYLLPILRYMDTAGVTTRLAEDRSVSEGLPKGWGTFSGGRS